MATLNTLQNACSAEPAFLLEQAQQQASLWDNWLQPVTQDRPAGEDPGYDDNFQQMREEVNKLSGADTSLTCELAETCSSGTVRMSALPPITSGRACIATVKPVWPTVFLCWPG
jgi:hypothetical protein